MRVTLAICALALSALCAGPPAARAASPFDGTWSVAISCGNHLKGQEYDLNFGAVVKDGHLHGEYGTARTPGWLALDGQIAPDGRAPLLAEGLVGHARYAMNGENAGSHYSYHVDAQFQPNHGSGRRVGNRPCTLDFTRS